MTTPLLSLNSVSCARGGLTVISDVTFDLYPGDALVLQGANGSGKTTLLRTVAGLQRAAKGTITADADSFAYAAHADGLKGPLTVAENLEVWATLFGVSQIDDALDAFQLSALKSRRAQALSAGQKRRLGLARLVLTGRPIWALDEPTVSLDRATVEIFAGVLKRHLAGGGAALIATHIDLGIDAPTLDMATFKPGDQVLGAFDETFA